MSKGPQPHTRAPKHRVPELVEESQQKLAVEINGNSDLPGEIEASWKSRFLRKGPTHRLTLSQALTLGSGGRTGSGDARDIQGKTEFCGFRARAEGIVPIAPLVSPLPVQPTSRHHLSYVEPKLNLHWPGEILSTLVTP